MEMLYVNKGLYNFLDIEIGSQKEVSINGLKYQIKMLENNSIEGILSPCENGINEKVILRYNTNSLYVMDRMFQNNKPDKDMLIRIIKQIKHCVYALEDYLLNPNDLILNPDYMFFDSADKKVKLICVPGYNQNLIRQLKNFLEYIMKIFNHRDKEGVLYLYELYDKVTNDELSFEIDDDSIDNVFMEHSKGAYQYKRNSDEERGIEKKEIAEKTNRQIICSANEQVDSEATIIDETEDINMIKKYMHIGLMFGIAILSIIMYLTLNKEVGWLWLCVCAFSFAVISLVVGYAKEQDEHEIEICMNRYTNRKNVLEESKYQKDYSIKSINSEHSNNNSQIINPKNNRIEEKKEIYKLVPLNNGAASPIEVGINEIKVGRSKDEADYRLKKNQISRVHARVFVEDGKLYVIDEASTNGTFINNARVTAHQANQINVGDVVAFATEEYFVA